MAYDKVVDASRLDRALTETADALRAKGASGEIPFDADTGFKDTVDVLKTGGYSEEMLIAMLNRTATEFILPEGVQRIPNGLCYRNFDLLRVYLPDTITYIGDDAFRDCKYLEIAELPSNVIELCGGCFNNTPLNTFEEIPASVQTIGIDTFAGCHGMTGITFLGTPTSIHARGFRNCTNLTTMRVPWSEGEVANAPWGATNATIIYDYTGEG